MQVWTQRMTDKTNSEMCYSRKERNEKLQERIREVKNSRRIQSVPSKKNYEQTISRKEPQSHVNS